jgi:hypothetical protein
MEGTVYKKLKEVHEKDYENYQTSKTEKSARLTDVLLSTSERIGKNVVNAIKENKIVITDLPKLMETYTRFENGIFFKRMKSVYSWLYPDAIMSYKEFEIVKTSMQKDPMVRSLIRKQIIIQTMIAYRKSGASQTEMKEFLSKLKWSKKIVAEEKAVAVEQERLLKEQQERMATQKAAMSVSFGKTAPANQPRPVANVVETTNGGPSTATRKSASVTVAPLPILVKPPAAKKRSKAETAPKAKSPTKKKATSVPAAKKNTKKAAAKKRG